MNAKIARWLLILGLGFVFIALGVDKFAHPILWIGWMPLWLHDVLGVSREQWLSVFGVVEILLGVLLLIPRRSFQRVVALLVALHGGECELALMVPLRGFEPRLPG